MGAIGLGANPPPASAIYAANGGPGFNPHDTNSILLGILNQLQILTSRLSPPILRQRIQITNLAVGASTAPQTINGDTFNAILVNLTAGTVDIYMGSPSPSSLLYTVSASGNPVPIYLPNTPITAQIVCVTNSASSGNANGIIDIVEY